MTNKDITPSPLSFNGGEGVSMTTHEIASRTSKRHDNVMRDAKKMLVALYGDGGLLKFEDTHTNPQNGQTYPVYRLPKRECLILVSGYSVELRASIIDRLDELEQGAPAAALDFSNPQVVLGVLTHLQTQVEEQKVRLKKLDRLEGAQGTMCVTNAAKTLGVKPKWLFEFMSSRRWIYKRAGNKNWIAYGDKLQALLLDHDDHMYLDSLGQERVAPRVLVTAKGLVKLADLIEQPLH